MLIKNIHILRRGNFFFFLLFPLYVLPSPIPPSPTFGTLAYFQFSLIMLVPLHECMFPICATGQLGHLHPIAAA